MFLQAAKNNSFEIVLLQEAELQPKVLRDKNKVVKVKKIIPQSKSTLQQRTLQINPTDSEGNRDYLQQKSSVQGAP